MDLVLVTMRTQALGGSGVQLLALRKRVEDTVTARIGVYVRSLMFTEEGFRSIYARFS